MLKNVLSSMNSQVPEFTIFYKFSSNPRSSRSRPLLNLKRCNSETVGKYAKLKSCKFWNSLPKLYLFKRK